MIRFFLILVTFFIAPAVRASSELKPQLTQYELAAYETRMKTNHAAAREYLDTRNYLSLCRQVIAKPESAIDLPVQPETYRGYEYLTSAERGIIDEAVNLKMAALLARMP
jgi:hypothetical protein